MCGIFGYIGSNDQQEEDPIHVCLNGLKHLEYRGYDSAGIAGMYNGEINTCKTAGRVHDLEKLVQSSKLKLTSAIAHTRWATHGKATHYNAHPHFDENKQLALVHNGIIENYANIKNRLIAQGVVFQSDTDTEVVAQLLALYYKGDVLQALSEVVQELEGAWAIAVIHKHHPQKIYAFVKDTPLVVATDPTQEHIYLSSDPNALYPSNLKVIYLKNHEIAELSSGNIDIFDLQGNRKQHHFETLQQESSSVSKDHFEHFMLKEIFEQPSSIRRAMENRLSEYFGTSHFEELTLSVHELEAVNRVLILGCGTSYHAGCLAATLFEEIARTPADVAIASEFRYSNPILTENTLVIAISQSGETADTLAAVKEVKAKGAKVIGICNVKNSKLSREADSCLFLKAGPELSVCSTKAFTSQLTVLSLLVLFIARLKHLPKEEGQHFLQQLKQLPHQIENILYQAPLIESLAKKYASFEHFFFIGRRYMYPTSLEAALKLKEISYMNATGYPAGELKHGPIALIDDKHLTIALCGNHQTYSKLLSNLMEIKSRSGPVLAFTSQDTSDLKAIAEDVLLLPSTSDCLAAVPYSVATQLFAYYIAKEKGTDIDKPKNLAKSVTVE